MPHFRKSQRKSADELLKMSKATAAKPMDRSAEKADAKTQQRAKSISDNPNYVSTKRSVFSNSIKYLFVFRYTTCVSCMINAMNKGKYASASFLFDKIAKMKYPSKVKTSKRTDRKIENEVAKALKSKDVNKLDFLMHDSNMRKKIGEIILNKLASKGTYASGTLDPEFDFAITFLRDQGLENLIQNEVQPLTLQCKNQYLHYFKKHNLPHSDRAQTILNDLHFDNLPAAASFLKNIKKQYPEQIANILKQVLSDPNADARFLIENNFGMFKELVLDPEFTEVMLKHSYTFNARTEKHLSELFTFLIKADRQDIIKRIRLEPDRVADLRALGRLFEQKGVSFHPLLLVLHKNQTPNEVSLSLEFIAKNNPEVLPSIAKELLQTDFKEHIVFNNFEVFRKVIESDESLKALFLKTLDAKQHYPINTASGLKALFSFLEENNVIHKAGVFGSNNDVVRHMLIDFSIRHNLFSFEFVNTFFRNAFQSTSERACVLESKDIKYLSYLGDEHPEVFERIMIELSSGTNGLNNIYSYRDVFDFSEYPKLRAVLVKLIEKDQSSMIEDGDKLRFWVNFLRVQSPKSFRLRYHAEEEVTSVVLESDLKNLTRFELINKEAFCNQKYNRLLDIPDVEKYIDHLRNKDPEGLRSLLENILRVKPRMLVEDLPLFASVFKTLKPENEIEKLLLTHVDKDAILAILSESGDILEQSLLSKFVNLFINNDFSYKNALSFLNILKSKSKLSSFDIVMLGGLTQAVKENVLPGSESSDRKSFDAEMSSPHVLNLLFAVPLYSLPLSLQYIDPSLISPKDIVENIIVHSYALAGVESKKDVLMKQTKEALLAKDSAGKTFFDRMSAEQKTAFIKELKIYNQEMGFDEGSGFVPLTDWLSDLIS